LPVIANVSGNTLEEYAQMAQFCSDAGVDMLELNISCPNIKQGGMAFGVDPASAAAVTEAAKKRARVPVCVKLSPNVTDIAKIARAVEAAGADLVSLINTIQGMKIDVNTRRPILRMNTGGLSGPAVLPVAVRMVWQVANAVRIPVIGMGGVSCGEDAAELMLAGASAVAVGTACFKDPMAPVRVIGELNGYLDRTGTASAAELVGAVRPWEV